MADTASKAPKQPPWHQDQDQESVSFGTWLKRQREARGIELREISDHTKISIRYLEALEVDRFEVLPAPVFTKGFLRQYGRYIGLDPDQVVNTYLNALHEEEADQEVSGGAGRGTTQRWLVSVLVLVVVGLLGLAGYRAFDARQSGSAETEVRPGIAAPPVAHAEILPETATVEETITAPLIHKTSDKLCHP